MAGPRLPVAWVTACCQFFRKWKYESELGGIIERFLTPAKATLVMLLMLLDVWYLF